MATPTQNVTNKEAPKAPAAKVEAKPANGTAPAVPGAPATAGEATEAEKEEAKRPGVIPHMPICVLWKDPAAPANKAVTAALIHPRDARMYKVTGRGMGGTKGTLEDEGYPIGPVRVEGPKWVEERIPKGVEVLGYANVIGFPLPAQD